MRVARTTRWLASLLLGTMLFSACSRDPASGGEQAAATPASAAQAAAARGESNRASAARSSAGPDIEFIAQGFRLEGARFGGEALQRRFAGDRADWSDALADPDALARFLAASRPVVICQSVESAVVAYHGPLFGAVLLTRWTLGRPVRLATVEVIPAVALADQNGPAVHWAEVLARADGVNPAQQAFLELVAHRARVLATVDACRPDWGQSPNRQISTKSPVIAEEGLSLRALYDSAQGVATVHRGVLALFQHGDAGPLTRLFGTEALAPLAAFTESSLRLQLVPVTRLGTTRGPAEQHLIVYADLLQPGRFVLVTALIPAALGASPGPTTPTPGVHPEFRATLVQP